MCWNCLQENHLDLPTSSERVADAVRYLSDQRALIASLDPTLNPAFSWTGFSGNQQMPVIVTYNLVDAADLPPVEGSHFETSYFSFNATQRANFRLALAEFSKVSGVIFVESQDSAMINAYGSTGSPYGGWANLANSLEYYTAEGALVVNDSTSFAKGGQGFHTILHELGHALGLKHPFEGDNRLVSGMDTTATTVMSYNYGPLRQTLGSLDVTALRALYGTAVNTSGWTMKIQNGDFVASGSGRADVITGVGLDNRLSGLLGNDILRGRQGHDTLYGGGGHDTLEGGNGADRLEGGTGNDRLVGARSNEVVYSDSLPDRIDTLLGGAGNDTLIAGIREGRLLGEDGNDLLRAAGGSYWDGADQLFGGTGNDTLIGSHEDDTLRGDAGNDQITTARAGDGDGGTGHDKLTGGKGNNQLLGGDGGDSLYGGAGSDDLRGGADADRIYGGTWGDTLLGESGADRLYGEDGNDILTGGAGYDALYGGNGNDTLYGGVGDTLAGGAGNDRIYALDGARANGGTGVDTFEFATGSARTSTITDFDVGVDRLRVDIGGTLSSITFGARNGGADTLAVVHLNGSTDTASIYFSGVTAGELSQGMFLIY